MEFSNNIEHLFIPNFVADILIITFQMRKTFFLSATLCLSLIASARPGEPENPGEANWPVKANTETESATFHNPFIWADVPDPDVIRVGDDFYMVSTTMHLMPGAPIMHSKDLVNWKTINYVFQTLDDLPRYSLNGGTVYGHGQWATSLRYHDGVFYLFFSPNDMPYRGYVYTATDPAGEWTLRARIPHFHDASLFFDDDGKVYIFSGAGYLRQLKSDLTDVEPGGIDTVVFEKDSTETGLLEGSRVIKKDGVYYLLMISWPNGGKRRQVCYRADNITGPYEKKVILESTLGGFPYVGQGTIVDDANGNWYGVIFQDRGGVGRVLTLSPCTWTDGWPILGDANGNVPEVMRKPVLGYTGGKVVTSDDFNQDALKLEWEWNHNPVNEAWSLSERPSYLRLKTSRTVDNLFMAPNTISQRMEGPACTGTVKMDISNMHDGDVAGISALQGDAAVLQVECVDGKKRLTAQTQAVRLGGDNWEVTGVETNELFSTDIDNDVIYLRMDADFRPGKDIAQLYYSLDGDTWHLALDNFKMVYDYTRLFMGTRYAIFNYATKETGGYVDIDWFKYNKKQDI